MNNIENWLVLVSKSDESDLIHNESICSVKYIDPIPIKLGNDYSLDIEKIKCKRFQGKEYQI